jgi:hypothetical protein
MVRTASFMMTGSMWSTPFSLRQPCATKLESSKSRYMLGWVRSFCATVPVAFPSHVY